MSEDQEPDEEVLRTLGRIAAILTVALIVFFLVLHLDKSWIVAGCASLSVAFITAFVGRRS